MKLRGLFLFLIFLLAVRANAAENANKNYGQIPLSFEANRGQADSRVKFLSRGPGYGLFLTGNEAILRLAGSKPTTVRMKVLGGRSDAQILGIDPTPGQTNYLNGSNPAGWTAGIPSYGRVRYEEVYPGIDLTYYGNQRQFEYDFTVAPGSRPETIRVRFDGLRKIEITADGDLLLASASGELRQPKPLIYQEIDGRRVTVDGGYVRRDDRTIGFSVGTYDKTQPLVIDPVIVFSSYWGGNATGPLSDQGNAIAVDATGNVYITGQTSSSNFPLFGPIQATNSGLLDGFVFKLDPTGTILLYSTFFGGTSNEEGHSIAVDAAGNSYITGFTSSENFPTTANAAKRTKSANQEAYLLKLNPQGNSLLYSTYLGGSGDDRAVGVAVDPKGGIYVTGLTGSTDFPTVTPVQSSNAGGAADVFVTKFGPTGAIQYSTYFGGRGNDQPYGIAVDAAGGAYVVGFTTSTNRDQFGNVQTTPNFPVARPLQPNYGGVSSDDAFIFKLSPAGNVAEYSTYWGGFGADNATRVAVNASGSACFTGYTNSEDFPIVSPVQFVPVGGYESFITCLAPDGQSAVFSTLYGGDGNDSGVGIAFDAEGNVYVAGYSDSILLNTVNAIQQDFMGQRDGFIIKLDPTGQTVLYSTYLGGTAIDAIVGLAVDPSGDVYVTGVTTSTDFPVWTPVQPENGGGGDVFVAKINASDIIATSNFQIAAQGASIVSTTSAATQPVFGYATADVTNGGSPTGIEIISLAQNNIKITEVALLAPEMTKVGRFFVEVDSVTRPVISIANTSDEEATVDFFFTDAAGETSGFHTQSVPAHTHFSSFVSEAPFSLGIGATGTINFTSSIPVAASAFRTINNERGDFILSSTPLVDPTNPQNDLPVTIPHFADGDGWDTKIVLVNPTEDTLHGELQFFTQGAGGKPVEPLAISLGGNDPAVAFEYEIPPRSSVRFQTPGTIKNSVVVTDPETGTESTVEETLPMVVGTIRVAPFVGSTTPQAHAILSWDVATINVFQTSIEALAPRTAMRFFAETKGPFDFEAALNLDPNMVGSVRTAVALANPSNREVSVALDLTKLDGTPLGLSTTVRIPAGGAYSAFLHEIPGFQNVPVPFQGVLRANSLDAVGVTGVSLRTSFNERFQFLGTTTGPIVENAGTPNQLIFPHIAAGQGYSTEYFLISRINGQGAAGTLHFVTQQGAPMNVTRKQ